MTAKLSDGEYVLRYGSGCSVRAEQRGKEVGMAKLVFGMNQSLDGYVVAPDPTLFRHFIDEAPMQAGSVYGRQMYEVMRYGDDDHPEWDAENTPSRRRGETSRNGSSHAH